MLPTLELEHLLHRQGYQWVAGVDEVGRGPLAGPVVAAAVVLPPEPLGPWQTLVRDSKTLSALQRERALEQIQRHALASGAGMVQPQEIDTLGIVRATRLAMRRAVEGLPLAPNHLLIDFLPLPECGIPFRALPRADARCLSVAAASIVAKVTRDRLMMELDGLYPGYGFARHKGYPTVAHRQALQRLGPSPVHRRSFQPVRALLALEEGTIPQPKSRASRGKGAEVAARHFLEGKGYRILDTNYRCPWGEVDIVAQEGDCVVFVEVRSRRESSFGTPSESVTRGKQERLMATAQSYLQARPGLPDHWRIDLVSVHLTRQGGIGRLEHLQHAVEEG